MTLVPIKKPRPSAVSKHIRTMEDKIDDVLTRQAEQNEKHDELRNMFEGMAERMDSMNLKLNEHGFQFAGLLKVLGTEAEDGDGGVKATGLFGKVRRQGLDLTKLKTDFRVWTAYGMGFMCAAAMALTGFWWLVGDKLDLILKH